MKIPYGVSSFYKLRKNGYLYIDKTAFIEKLENTGNYLALLRPRRFGKSLFVSTLMHYYDEKMKDEFDSLFDGLYIHKHPTKLRNSYKVLLFEFSGINTDKKNLLYEEFLGNIKRYIIDFLEKYYDNDAIKRIENINNVNLLMKNFFLIVKDSKLYVMIDEYDHFANSLIADDLEFFKSVMGRGGFVRQFYETLKAATMLGTVDRIFITGVTPITLDSLTSGFNIKKNITNNAEFNDCFGFTEREMETILDAVFGECGDMRDEILEKIHYYYDSYKFDADIEHTIYNPDMLLYFAKNFDIKNCRYPKNLIDTNMASDYGKVMKMCRIYYDSYRVIEEILTTGEVSSFITEEFSFEKDIEHKDFISLLYYMGLLTIKGVKLGSMVSFKISNYVIERLFYDYFRKVLEERGKIRINSGNIERALLELYMNNDMKPLMDEARNIMGLLSNRDFIRFDEKHIKILLLSLLNMNDSYYIKSEAEVNGNYPDILLLERPPYKMKYQFLIELKRGKDIEKKLSEGEEQVKRYLELEDIRSLKKLKRYVIASDGKEIRYREIE